MLVPLLVLRACKDIHILYTVKIGLGANDRYDGVFIDAYRPGVSTQKALAYFK